MVLVMGDPRVSPTRPHSEQDTKAEPVPDRPHTHVACMVVGSSPQDTDPPRRLGPVAAAWMVAGVEMPELVVSQ